MTNVLERKEIIHIVVEVVVLAGITFYFSSKNKKLLDNIQVLSKKLEEQSEIIQKHEHIIMQLVKSVQSSNNISKNKHATVNIIPNSPKIKKNSKNFIKKIDNVNDKNNVKDNPKINDNAKDSDSDNSDLDDSELDNEIAKELEELEELEELQKDDGLKKKT
jgi:hypothetical protein